MANTSISGDLEELAQRYQEARSVADELRAQRDRAIIKASANGESRRHVARRAGGISVKDVQRIVGSHRSGTPDVHTTLRSLYTTPPKPKPDSTTPTGRLQAAVQQPDPPDPEERIVDATVIDDPDPGTDWLPAPLHKQWATATTKAHAMRALMREASGPIQPGSAAEALTDAAVKARELAAHLYDLASELRKLTS